MRSIYPRILIIALLIMLPATLIIYGVNLANHLFSQPVVMTDITPDYSVRFEASSPTILTKDGCVSFRWDAENIAAIYFDGRGRVGGDSVERCPGIFDLPKTYELEIEHVDGTQSTYAIELRRAIPRFISIMVFTVIVLAVLLAAYIGVQRAGIETTKQDKDFSSIWVRTATYLAVTLTPLILTMVMLWFLQGKTLNDTMPFSVDGIMYWHQAASFAEVGFNSGYYTVDEMPAGASFSPYFAWGAGPPILYGSIGKIFSWNLSSMPIADLAMLTIAIAFTIFVLRPNLRQTFWLWLLLATFPYTYIFATTHMLPLLQQSTVLVAAALFSILIVKGKTAPLWVKIGLGLWLVFAVVIRATMGVLWLPYLLLIFPSLRVWLATIASILLLGFGIIFQSWWSSYFPMHVTLVTDAALAGQLSEAFNIVWATFSNNMFHLSNLNGFPQESAYRIAMLIVISGLIANLIVWSQRQHGRLDFSNGQVRVWVFSLFVLLFTYGLAIFIFKFTTSNYSNEMRYMSPLLLLVLVIMIATKQFRFVRFTTILFVFVLPFTWMMFDRLASEATDSESHRRYQNYSQSLATNVQYDPEAPNQWCNSVLVEHGRLSHDAPFMVAFTPGIGLTWGYEPYIRNASRFRSAYVVLSDRTASEVLPGKNMEPLQEVVEGKIYHNLDSDCYMDDNG